jgi:hypothetical protein
MDKLPFERYIVMERFGQCQAESVPRWILYQDYKHPHTACCLDWSQQHVVSPELCSKIKILSFALLLAQQVNTHAKAILYKITLLLVQLYELG